MIAIFIVIANLAALVLYAYAEVQRNRAENLDALNLELQATNDQLRVSLCEMGQMVATGARYAGQMYESAQVAWQDNDALRVKYNHRGVRAWQRRHSGKYATWQVRRALS